MRRRAAGAVEASLPEALGAERDVLEHAHVVGQREMLVHHADAGIERGAGIARRQSPAERLDRALVGDIVAEQDVHQRGLAGAVLAEQRDHLAALQVEGDGVVGDQRAEPLGHAVEAQHDRRAFVLRIGGWLLFLQGRHCPSLATNPSFP